MTVRLWTAVVLVLPAMFGSPAFALGNGNDTPVSWRKTVIDPKFRSEGVAIGDVNRDGKLDVLIGDSWYEAPGWTKHDIRQPGDYGDGLHTYSQCMTCWSDDINGDGWVDRDRGWRSRRAGFLVREPQGQARLLAPARDLAQRLQRDAALCGSVWRRPSAYW